MEAFRQFFDTTSSTFTYVLVDPGTRDAVMIDPVDTQLDEYLGRARAARSCACATCSKRMPMPITSPSAGRLCQSTGAKAAAPVPLRDPARRHAARGWRGAPIRRRDAFARFIRPATPRGRCRICGATGFSPATHCSSAAAAGRTSRTATHRCSTTASRNGSSPCRPRPSFVLRTTITAARHRPSARSA